jgi:hypothetical protein
MLLSWAGGLSFCCRKDFFINNGLKIKPKNICLATADGRSGNDLHVTAFCFKMLPTGEIQQFNMTTLSHTCSGFCTRCQTVHTLPLGPAKTAAMKLIGKLDRAKRLDFHLPIEKADPCFSTDYLFGPARGKMFGVMVCRLGDGSMLTLKSFSGQYNGQWQLEGWAAPLFDLQQWHAVNDNAEKEIKALGRRIDAQGSSSAKVSALVQMRKKRSRQLMQALHRIYSLHNFRGQCRPLSGVCNGRNGIPNGTADCCGPKLINFAARNNLRAIGLAEFYYGRENKRGNRIHGHFYPSCREKCGLIMGYMLCGLPSPFQKPEDTRSRVAEDSQ